MESGRAGEAPALDATAVAGAALQRLDRVAEQALALFCRIFGQTAGDLALVAQSTGGVYLAGGIAPKILPLLQQGEFLAGFRDKGRFAAWMERVPVHVVLDEDVGLKGAALAATL
jgi:glucokinase